MVFVVLGILAVALPGWATIALEQLLAALLVVWGIGGIGFALSLRPRPAWSMTAAVFAMVLILGVIFLLFPTVGVRTVTIVIVTVFLLEGVLSISFGLSLRGLVSGWVGMVLSGAMALIIGLIVLSGWPGTAGWILGLLVGVNFLSTGLALLVISAAVGRDQK